MEFYKTKRDFHHKQWELAQEAGKEKTAKFHMEAYIDYSEMYDRTLKRVEGEE